MDSFKNPVLNFFFNKNAREKLVEKVAYVCASVTLIKQKYLRDIYRLVLVFH